LLTFNKSLTLLFEYIFLILSILYFFLILANLLGLN
jgi:hypothetical protein